MSEEIEGMDRLRLRLAEIFYAMGETRTPLLAAGAVVQGSIQKNFDAQGRPTRWTPLSPRTLAGRRKGRGSGGPKILIDRARLKNSVNFKLVSGPGVQIGTNVVYARRQHSGYPGGGGRGQSKTPARPFLMMQPEDVLSIERIFVRHITKRFG